jgi:beta-mannosidase
MGSLYWQINDCWPTMSWASVDYFGRWKALHYAVRKAFQSIYPIIVKGNDQIHVKIANDKLKPEKTILVATLYDFSGKCLWTKQIETLLRPNSSMVYLSIPERELLALGDKSKSVLELEVKTDNSVLAENFFYFKACKDLALEKPVIQKFVRKTSDQEYEISLTTDKLAKNVALITSKSEGVFSDNYFDMIPGKTYKIIFKGNASNLAEELEIMCVNNSYKQ